MTFQKAKLKDIYNFQYGKGNTNPDNGGIYPIYWAGSIMGHFDKYNSEDSPVIGHMGAHCGKVIFGKGKHFVTYNGIMALIKDGNNSLFGYYTLLSKNLHESIATRGSAQPFISYDLLNDIDIYLPDLSNQNYIASILSSYDDLIENNEKRIKILEEMSRLLYQEWFVKFQFPGHESMNMIESNTQYGKIPEGWEVKKLKEIGKIVTWKTPPTWNIENFGGNIPFIKTPDVHGNMFILKTEQTLSVIGWNTQSLKLVPENSVFVTCIGTIWVVGITSVPSQTNQQINTLVLDEANDYCYYYLFAKTLKQKLVWLGWNGATMGNVNKDKFENIDMLYPSLWVRELFYSKTGKLFDEIKQLQKQNATLAKTRDLLIPQLVTGKRELH